MRTVEIEIECIAHTCVDRAAVRRWLDRLGAENFQIPEPEACSDPALLIALAAKRCYMSFEPGLNPNVTKVRSDMVEYLDNVLGKRHGSVLEHSSYTFAIEGVSRVFTAEMNRHRAGVGISEASMRYIRYRDIPYWLPDSIKLSAHEKVDLETQCEHQDVDNPGFLGVNGETPTDVVLSIKKWRTQKVFEMSFKQDEKNYQELQEIWKDELAEDSKFAAKKHITSMMRRIIPLGVATGGVWTMNMRAVRHILAMRGSEEAEEEMIHVFSRIIPMMIEREPMLLGDFVKVHGFYKPKYEKV